MEPFKSVYSPGLVSLIGRLMSCHWAGFNAIAFENAVLPRLETLELKARAQLIADALHVQLPGDAEDRNRILTAVLHPDPLDHAAAPSDEDGICGWGILPLTMIVGQHGLDAFDSSMAALAEMTKRFSSEFGIRHFLVADQDRALAIMSRWVDDPNRHVRRLVSEGTRPRLPWAMQLPALRTDPAPVLPILTGLRDDPEEYVRRSVANHLNDIAKDHPALVTRIARDWMNSADDPRRALLRHACRGLIKAGDVDTLAVFGRMPPRLAPVMPRLSAERVGMGEDLTIAADLSSTTTEPQELTVDYVLHFRKANGQLSPKVFKGATLTLQAGESREFRRIHRFREVTTRRHYPGQHAITLRVNGQDSDRVTFHLACAAP